jgi:cob(I)alamin adenosyltransferase
MIDGGYIERDGQGRYVFLQREVKTTEGFLKFSERLMHQYERLLEGKLGCLPMEATITGGTTSYSEHIIDVSKGALSSLKPEHFEFSYLNPETGQENKYSKLIKFKVIIEQDVLRKNELGLSADVLLPASYIADFDRTNGKDVSILSPSKLLKLIETRLILIMSLLAKQDSSFYKDVVYPLSIRGRTRIDANEKGDPKGTETKRILSQKFRDTSFLKSDRMLLLDQTVPFLKPNRVYAFEFQRLMQLFFGLTQVSRIEIPSSAEYYAKLTKSANGFLSEAQLYRKVSDSKDAEVSGAQNYFAHNQFAEFKRLYADKLLFEGNSKTWILKDRLHETFRYLVKTVKELVVRDYEVWAGPVSKRHFTKKSRRLPPSIPMTRDEQKNYIGAIDVYISEKAMHDVLKRNDVTLFQVLRKNPAYLELLGNQATLNILHLLGLQEFIIDQERTKYFDSLSWMAKKLFKIGQFFKKLKKVFSTPQSSRTVTRRIERTLSTSNDQQGSAQDDAQQNLLYSQVTSALLTAYGFKTLAALAGKLEDLWTEIPYNFSLTKEEGLKEQAKTKGDILRNISDAFRSVSRQSMLGRQATIESIRADIDRVVNQGLVFIVTNNKVSMDYAENKFKTVIELQCVYNIHTLRLKEIRQTP